MARRHRRYHGFSGLGGFGDAFGTIFDTLRSQLFPIILGAVGGVAGAFALRWAINKYKTSNPAFAEPNWLQRMLPALGGILAGSIGYFVMRGGPNAAKFLVTASTVGVGIATYKWYVATPSGAALADYSGNYGAIATDYANYGALKPDMAGFGIPSSDQIMDQFAQYGEGEGIESL